MSLKDIKHWVFDMDGTLTVAVHDFPFIRQYLEIPGAEDILTHLATLPPRGLGGQARVVAGARA